MSLMLLREHVRLGHVTTATPLEVRHLLRVLLRVSSALGPRSCATLDSDKRQTGDSDP
jgi:hypothetical protein